MQTRSGSRPHTVGGVDHLQEKDVREYLIDGGYAGEADGLIAKAKKLPYSYHYSEDRHRYVAFFWEFWVAGDSTISEERIKALRARSTAFNHSRSAR